MKPVAAPTTIARQLEDERVGRVVRAADAEYDRLRVVFAGGIDHRPAAIVQPDDAEGIARIVGVARHSGLELAVRSGGHSPVGHSISDGGIVIDLRAMRGLEIDPESRTAWAQTGLTAGEYTSAAGEHGLATGFGDTGTVGLGGITLGGGVGYLSRRYGLTIDDLLAAEIVTADGRILEVDAERHPDLFWAIRGGGGNFGVATRFRYRLHELPEVVGGMLMLPASADVLAAFMAAAEAAPDELSMIVNVMPAPPMPFVPVERQGELVVMALACYAGPAAEGERAFAPFRALAAPIADMIRPMPYPEIYPPEPEDYHPTAVARTMFIEAVDGEVARLVLERLRESDASMRVVQLRPLGGAIARVPVEETAYAHRHSRIMANVAAFYEGPEDRPGREAWVEQLAADLLQSDSGAYVNFLADEGADRVRAAYPGATWERLTQVKRRYDPDNLFRLNQNIPPA